MKQGFFQIIENRPLTQTVYRMVLKGDVSAITAPGQFVNIKLNGLYLRRPISVCDVEGDCLTIVYKVVGKGTEQMVSWMCSPAWVTATIWSRQGRSLFSWAAA